MGDEASGVRRALSVRERDVLERALAGERNGEIAEGLCLSVKTVEAHLHRAMAALDARTVRQAVARYATTKEAA